MTWNPREMTEAQIASLKAAAETKPTTQVEIAHFTWCLGDLIGAGVPILDSFCMLGEVFPRAPLRLLAYTCWFEVREGNSLMEAFEIAGQNDIALLAAVDYGEETGEIDVLLPRYAAMVLNAEDAEETLAQTLGRRPEATRLARVMHIYAESGKTPAELLELYITRKRRVEDFEFFAQLHQMMLADKSLSEALESMGGVDPVFTAIIRAGEIGKVTELLVGRLVNQDRFAPVV